MRFTDALTAPLLPALRFGAGGPLVAATRALGQGNGGPTTEDMLIEALAATSRRAGYLRARIVQGLAPDTLGDTGDLQELLDLWMFWLAHAKKDNLSDVAVAAQLRAAALALGDGREISLAGWAPLAVELRKVDRMNVTVGVVMIGHALLHLVTALGAAWGEEEEAGGALYVHPAANRLAMPDAQSTALLLLNELRSYGEDLAAGRTARAEQTARKLAQELPKRWRPNLSWADADRLLVAYTHSLYASLPIRDRTRAEQLEAARLGAIALLEAGNLSAALPPPPPSPTIPVTLALDDASPGGGSGAGSSGSGAGSGSGSTPSPGSVQQHAGVPGWLVPAVGLGLVGALFFTQTRR